MNQDVARKKSMTMTDAAREAANAYKREWNKRNPEKNKEYQRRYWAKKAAEAQAAQEKTDEQEAQEV